MHNLLVIIPSFNEEKNLPGVVAGIRRVLSEADILVVNDGSADATASICRDLGVAVVSHPWNMGYGVAIQTGYKYAYANSYEFLVQIDADGQHDPADIPRLLEPLAAGSCDFVLGSRFLAEGSYQPPLTRRIGMKLFSALIKVATGECITDSTSGFQAFNAEVIHFLTGDHFPCDYPDADLLLVLHRAGFRMIELPVVMHSDEGGRSMHSGLRPLYYIFKMFLSMGVNLIRSVPERPGRAQ